MFGLEKLFRPKPKEPAPANTAPIPQQPLHSPTTDPVAAGVETQMMAKSLEQVQNAGKAPLASEIVQSAPSQTLPK